MNSYKKTLDYMFRKLPMFQRIGAAAYKADLDNITKLCNTLNNPQDNLKFIHIAGTNGKGSVTHALASILQESGLKVGVFCSPHYKDFRERVKVNNKFISKDFVVKFVECNKTLIDETDASFFEMTTAMAFEYFAQKKVDIVVLETGMGGRLDSTNIVTPILSIITNISFDHQQFLGNTLPKIAFEKAGIIKKNIPVIIGETQKETTPVFTKQAAKLHSKIIFADKKIRIENINETDKGISFSYHEREIKISLFGSYQIKNIKTVLMAVEELKNLGYRISHKNLKNGLKNIHKNTFFIGRWMILQYKPLAIADSAHNEAGLRELVAQIKKYQYNKLHFVYGTVVDKDLSKVFPILPKTAHYYFCKPDIPRGKNEAELAQEAFKSKLIGEHYTSVKKAFKAALKRAEKNDLVIVSGSIFVVAEIL
jgi:dihydrofolate synthase/folylpolyglutamate synthase